VHGLWAALGGTGGGLLAVFAVAWVKFNTRLVRLEERTKHHNGQL
jgi:hypothetical protein